MMHSRLNRFPSSSSSGLATAPPLFASTASNNENMTMMPSLKSSSNSNGFKTPSSSKHKGSKGSTRRALGDISNKKPQRGASRKDGTTPGVQKLHIASTNSAASFKPSRNNSLKQQSQAPTIKPQKSASSRSSTTQKQVNFVLPPAEKTITTLSMDLLGLDPIEMPAGRLYSERWEDDVPLPPITPKLDDLQDAVWEQRIQARMRHQERIEQEGEALLLRQMEQVLLQDELDVQRYDKDMMLAPQYDSFDLALEVDSDSDFLNVSF